MRAILTNFGSTGSVYPFISLAKELQDAGHQPVVALSDYFASWVEHFNLEFAPIGPDLREVQYDINEAMQDMPESDEWVRELLAPLFPALPQMFEELSQLCVRADVLISGPWQPASMMIHEITEIPFVTVQNAHFGGGGAPAFQRASADLINPFRARYGLAPVSNPLTIDANSPELVIYNMSRHVRPPLPDWPSHYHMPGYLFLDDETWKPEAGLEDFIEEGPPVVISFGSMTHDDPDALTALILAAIDMAGCRAVIQQGWSGLARRKVPEDVYVSGFVPHDWLFPRASCIVHHGGSGTSASAFRSGVPSVVVPHTFDQPLWAELAYGAGCAVPPIPYLKLTSGNLGQAIAEILRVPAYSKAAVELGWKVRSEAGLKDSRLLIEQLISFAATAEVSVGDPADERRREEKIEKRRGFQQQQRARRVRA